MNEFNLPKHSIQEEPTDDEQDYLAGANDDAPIISSQDALIDSEAVTPQGLEFSKQLTSFLKQSETVDDEGNVLKVFKAPETAWVHNLIRLHGQKFDFTGRNYLIPIYNGNQKRVLLQTARQVEKCVPISTQFLSATNSLIRLSDLRVGDAVVSYTDSGKCTTDRIVGIESNGVRPILRVTTKKKRTVLVSENHPFRRALDWCPAKELQVGDFIAIPHRAGSFGEVHCPQDMFILDLLISGCVPANKVLHPDCYELDKESTQQLLRGLWATDGHCKNVSNSKVDICYSSTSKGLIDGVQRLLLKFGVFSSVRANKPTLYKGTDKVAYILRVTGRESIERFHSEVGPILGKPFDIPSAKRNSNTHTDIFWDEVTSIEKLPPEETFAVETAKYHNYVTDGIITHNSTFLGNKIIVRSAIIPYFRCLYVSPSHVQTRTFSNDRLKPIIETSPIISKYLQNSKVSQQVFEKGFTNGSFVFLRSAFLSADRARGISADTICIDELQDILISNVPVLLQCLSHSKYAYEMFAGTPKTFDNTITQYWERTTQCEWMVPCSGCSGGTGKKWNYLDKTNIGLRGPICKFCGKGLDVSMGQWQKAMASEIYGYRISQLMVPWIVKKDSEAWKTMIMQMETYPESQFQNEVLGLPYDNAAKPITRAQLLLCCDPNHKFIQNPLNPTAADIHIANNHNLIGGVDWGEGNDGSDKGLKGKFKTASYTIFTIGAYISKDKFKVFFMKRFTGKEIDPEYIVSYIAAVYTKLNMKMIGVDWGFGWGVNNSLFRKVGPQHCVQFMYVDRQKQTRKWDHVGYKFQLLRNHVISEVFYGLKKQEFTFPRFDSWISFAKDILNVGVEYSEYQRKMMYIHRSSEPDDSLHSLLYCREAAKIFHGRYV